MRIYKEAPVCWNRQQELLFFYAPTDAHRIKSSMLGNEKYTGDVLVYKTFMDGYR